MEVQQKSDQQKLLIRFMTGFILNHCDDDTVAMFAEQFSEKLKEHQIDTADNLAMFALGMIPKSQLGRKAA